MREIFNIIFPFILQGRGCMQEEELIQLHTMFAQMKNEMGKELPGEQVFFVIKDKKVIQKLRG